MLSIFYKDNGKIKISTSGADLSLLRLKSVIWIDLLEPSGEEKRAAERFLGVEIQSRAEAEEIESSSRFRETDKAIFANTNFLVPSPEEYYMEAVSFTLVDGCLTTLRDAPIRSFTELQRRMPAQPRVYVNGYWVFVSILDLRVDLDADMIELMSKEISQFSRRVNQQEDINEDLILDLNQLQENTMIVRENIVDKQRLVMNLLKSDKLPPELEPRFNVLQQDISSLIKHTEFSFERLENLQETVVGLINLDQNKLMRLFTVIQLLLMPPTLIASFYGMNVELPWGSFSLSWLLIIGIMLISIVVIYLIFKRKKML